jgi:hypothetical protein
MSARHRQVGVLVVALLFVMVISGCASARVRQEPADFSLDAASASSEDSWKLRVGGARLTSSQLESTNAWWTAEAVSRLRPDFLRGSTRGPLTGRPEIAVYLNGARAGDASMLNSIPLHEVREIVFLQPFEARAQFGPSCPCANGAILVTTRTVRDP